MADVDMDPFGDHNKMDVSHPGETGENIPLNPGGEVIGGSTWEPEQETFRRTSLKGEVLRERVKGNMRT